VANFLVTGGCGFIGSHLVDSLIADGHRVSALDDLSTGRRENLHPQAELIIGDVACVETTNRAMAGIDGCFHLAAIASVQRSNEDWLGTHRANQVGAIAVLDAARATAIRAAIPVVYASSAAVYGTIEGDIAEESLRPQPLTAYGADKFGCELHAAVASLVHGVPTLGLRFFNVYGPRQDPKSPYSGVISIFAERICQGQSITIHGDGSQQRDFVYVADVVAHLRAAMERATTKPCVLNVCTGRATSVLELATALGVQSDRVVEIVFSAPRPGDIARSLGCPQRACSMLGVRARTTLAEGLRELIRWRDALNRQEAA
jgi:UDP-glucose 4-epimerase